MLAIQTSMPGTPSRSRPPSRPTSRPTSPTRAGASKRPAPGPLLLAKSSNADPLRAFPTEVSQRIFALMTIADLARCSRVCKKWSKSQTLNYGMWSRVRHFFLIAWHVCADCTNRSVWFQLYRKDNFHDDDLPPGKWTRRESKQNWVCRADSFPSLSRLC